MIEKRTRRRGARLEQAILAAAWEELADRGWAGFGIEGVAVRCGTAKTVIYRRWPNRAELAQDMLLRAAAETADSDELAGDLRSDLLLYLQRMIAFCRGPFGEAMKGVISDGDPQRRGSVLTAAPVTPVREIFDAARARGDVRRDLSPIVQNLGHALLLSEFLHVGPAVPEATLVAIVDEVWLPAVEVAQRADENGG